MATILIVEDDKNISDLIIDFLTLADYTTDFAYTGKEAVTKIRQGSYDLILLDIMLPEMDGFTVIRQIRDLKTPVLF